MPDWSKVKTIEEAPDWGNIKPASAAGVDWGKVSAPPEREPAKDEQWDKMSKFHKVLDIVGRPGYAVKSIIKASGDDLHAIMDRTDIGEDEKLNLMSKQNVGAKAAMDAAWRGFTGQERVNMNEVWGDVGVKGIPFLGFASEVLVDPLMYGGYSAITKGLGKTLGVTGKVLGKVPGVTPAVKQVGKVIAPVADWMKDRFVTKSGIPKLSAMVDRWLSERRWLKGKEISYAAKTRLAMNSIAKKAKAKVKDVQKRIVNIIELRNHPEELSKVVPNITAEEQVLANTLKMHFDNILISEMKAGVPIQSVQAARSAKIAKLRRNLNLTRRAYQKELAISRRHVVKEVSTYSDERLNQYLKGLTGEKAALERAALAKNRSRITNLDSEISKVEQQLDMWEKQRRYLVRVDKPTKMIDNRLDKLENQFWYLHSEMAERLQDVPELAKGSTYVRQIGEIEKLLASDIEVNLGRKGVSLSKQLMDIQKKAGKLKATEIGIPKGKGKSLLKQLTTERAKRDFGYFPRITTQEATEYLRQARIGKTKVWSTKLANALKRKTDDFTLEEFNSFVESFGLKSLGGRHVEAFFMADPAYAVAVRGARSAKAVTSAQFLKDVGVGFGKKAADAPLHWVELPSGVVRLNPSLKGLMFEPDVAGEIGKMADFYLNPKYAGRFIRAFDAVQNMWKKWTLAIFPKYHLRNMVGNMWNNHLADVKVVNYSKAEALQLYKRYGTDRVLGEHVRGLVKKAGFTFDEANKIINDAERLGVLSGGWYAADVEQSLRSALKKGGITGRGMAVGTAIENNARLAHYLDRLTKGSNSMDAALSVKKYLFDYADLTHFERSVMKRLFPFYTWTRKNVPLQLEHLWKQPQKYAPIAAPLRSRNPQDLLRLKYARPDVYDRLPIELRRDADSVTYVPLEGLIPAADLADMVRPQEIFLDLLTPYLRAPLELAFNKSLYFESELNRYPSQTQELLRLDLPTSTKYLLTTVVPWARMINEVNKVVRKRRRGEVPLSFGETVFSQTLSSVYKVSLEELKTRALKRVKHGINELRQGAASALQQDPPREEEFKRIMKEVDKALAIVDKIK
ncbi:hypothetical protein LCGC14_0686870 [marine sediment metagenome]|uniref:Large polyvalent protein associated domain-containing protein n=1 Tax=marine sediment metagenome TaxID=412755 RepID=A0A0F9R6X5_9ZZZZ